MKTLVLATLLVVLSLVHAQYTKLYYFWPSETFSITLSTTSGLISTPTGCNCSTPAGWLTSCQVTVNSNSEASISLQIANTGGYCSSITFATTSTNIAVAFIEYLYITPVARPTYTGQSQSFTLQTQPPLSFAQLQTVMQGSFKISSTLVSGVDTGSLTSLSTSFSDSDITRLAQESVLLENQYYMVDLALVDSMMSFSINQPLILYKKPIITSVTPKLARRNTNVNFNVATSGNDFTTNTGIVKVSTSAVLGQNAVDGTLISSRQIQVVQQVTDVNNTFAVSLDGSQYDAQVSGFVEGFDFPATNTITYSTPSDGIDNVTPATGCSIFAFNNLTFSSPNLISQPSNWGDITIRIKDEGFARTGYCNWTIVNNNVAGFSCPCPELWDLNVGLPQTFTYELQFNGVDWYSSTSFNGAPRINYYAPKQFTTSPVGKLLTGTNNTVTISGMKNRYKPATLTYTLYARGIGANVPFVPAYAPDANGDGSATGPFSDVANLNTLCGCSAYRLFDYSANVNCTCRADPLCYSPTPATTVNTIYCQPDFVCTVSTIMSVNRGQNPGTSPVEYTASTPYYIYGPIDCGDPKCSPRQVTPKNVPLGNTQRIDIYAIQGKFLNNAQLMYKLSPTTDTYMPVSSGSGTVGVLNYVSDKRAYFTVQANTAQQTAMTLSISQNGGTDYDTLSAQIIRFYDPNAITYTQIIGSQGVVNSTLPADLAITVVGNNFFPSDNIYIRFDRPFVQLVSNCSFNSTTTLICITPNMLATGVFLPSVFSVSISYDTGSAFLPTGVNLQFEESIQPVIVQIVPPMGPINADPLASKASPDGTYTISIKGLTNAVTGCAFVYPYNDTATPTIKGIITSGPNNQQVDCTVPVQVLYADAMSRKDQYNKPAPIQFPAQYAVYLLTAIDTQKSEPFPFKFYMNPNLTSIYPANVAAFGGDSVIITGPNLQEASDYTVGFKIVDTQSTSNCVPINGTAIRCTTPAHPDGKNLQVSITYNQYQFVSMPASVPFTVDPCPVGYSATDFTKKCQPCEAGRYKPLQGFFDCIDCEQGRYQSQPAQQLCVGCPRFTITTSTRSTNITQCDCQPGYFRPNNTLPGIDCNACPTGGNCTGLGFSPTPQPGYWYNTINSRPNAGSYIFDSCEPHPLRCTGVLSVNGGCATGRSGVLCGDCMSGWFKSGEDCKMCTDDVRLRFIIVVAVIIALVIVFFKFAQLKVAYLSSISIAVSYFQIIAVFSLYDFKWPQSLKNAIQVLQFINLNIDIVVPECISIITYGLKWGVTVSLPAIFGACLIAAFSLELMRSIIVVWTGPLLKPYIMNWYRIDNRNFVTKFCTEQRRDIAMLLCNPKNGPEMKEFSDMCIHTFMIIISFSYVFVITKASEIFNCQWVPESGLNIMVADTTVTCYQGVWWAYFPFSIGLIIAFGLGTILLFLYITLNRKKIVKDKVFNDRFRFLFVRFRNERLFWEAVIVIRKLLISVAIIFFAGYPMLVILFCMFVIFCSFILQTHHVPFRRVFHNIMEYVQLLATEFLLFAALLFYVDAFPDEWNKDALGYITIIVVVFCTVIIVCLILLDVMSQIRRSWKTNHEAKLAKGAVAVSAVPIEDGGDVELPDVVVSPDSAPYQVLQSPMSPTSPASTVNLLDIPDTPAPTNNLQNAPSFVLKVQQKLPKPHPKVAKATNLAWNKFTTFLDRIEGDDLDNIDWAKIKEQAEAEEARKALEEQQRLEKEKEIAQEVQNLDQLPPNLDNSGDIELVDSPIHADEVIAVEEEITIDDSQYHNM